MLRPNLIRAAAGLLAAAAIISAQVIGAAPAQRDLLRADVRQQRGHLLHQRLP